MLIKFRRCLIALMSVAAAACLMGAVNSARAGPIYPPVTVVMSVPVKVMVTLPALPAKPVVAKAPVYKPTDVEHYLPVRAAALAPIMLAETNRQWADHPFPYLMMAQAEHESCISMTHSRCLSPTSELKTFSKTTGLPIEYGFGFGQTTIAYDSNGKERFNNYKAMRAEVPTLRDWAWEDRFNPVKQVTVMVFMMHKEYRAITWTAIPEHKYTFGLVSYNSGRGGLLKDRTLCGARPPCNPNLWYANVEVNSYKRRTVVAGYGKSNYEISRHYAPDIMRTRGPKYQLLYASLPFG
jgi:hypothetical protein